jgi:hypothetical protein
MDLGLIYRALVDHQVDVVAGNSTDGLISALGLVGLEDDRHYFPPYDAVPIVRKATLERFPALRGALADLAGKVSASDIRQLNYAVDGLHREPAAVVREFRKTKGLYAATWRTNCETLLRYPEIFSETPRLIHPLRLAVEAGVVCEADEFVVRIFVGTFRPDRFILFELNGYRGFRDGGFLPGAGAKVHFDAVRCFIEEGDVRELLEVEVGAEFAIDARKQVEIEGGGHTDWIIIGGDQCFFGLEHVDAEQKRVPGLKNLTQIAKKVRAGGAIEVADGTAEEKHEKMLGGSAAGGNFA